MKHVKSYALYEADQTTPELTPSQIKFLKDYVDGTWRINPSTGLVDIDGDIRVNGMMLDGGIGKVPVRLGVVTGNFNGSYSGLTSYEGCPSEVGGDFISTNCNAGSLKGVPKRVGGRFVVSGQRLISLNHMPKKIGGDVDVSNRPLRSLVGCTPHIKGNFECTINSLKSLEGAPLTIDGVFSFEDMKSATGGYSKNGERRHLIINWDLEGWIAGFKMYPELFTKNFIMSRINLKTITPEHLKIVTSHSNMNFIRKNIPELWNELKSLVGDSDAAEVSADLGELGF